MRAITNPAGRACKAPSFFSGPAPTAMSPPRFRERDAADFCPRRLMNGFSRSFSMLLATVEFQYGVRARDMMAATTRLMKWRLEDPGRLHHLAGDAAV